MHESGLLITSAMQHIPRDNLHPSYLHSVWALCGLDVAWRLPITAHECLCECARYGKSMFFLGWHEIRQTLYESLPEGVVQFKKQFKSYSDQGDGGVSVRFKAML